MMTEKCITFLAMNQQQYQHASEIAVGFAIIALASLAQFLRSRRAICSTDRTYTLPGSHVWAVLSSEKSRSPATAIKVSKSRHNSRTNLRTKVLSMQIRANIDISLYCLFQLLVFSERREMLVTDRQTDRQTDRRTIF